MKLLIMLLLVSTFAFAEDPTTESEERSVTSTDLLLYAVNNPDLTQLEINLLDEALQAGVFERAINFASEAGEDISDEELYRVAILAIKQNGTPEDPTVNPGVDEKTLNEQITELESDDIQLAVFDSMVEFITSKK